MSHAFSSIEQHRVRATAADSVVIGEVRYAPLKSLWFLGMAAAAIIGGYTTFTLASLVLFYCLATRWAAIAS
ncbi:MAG: hypothetical protein V4641_22420 [Pseudomonadota bacterium]